MDITIAIDNIMLGESMASIASTKRVDLCVRAGVDPEDDGAAFTTETSEFMRRLCRELGDYHAGDGRIAAALVDWVARCRDYEAWDALMSGFQFEGRERYVERGRSLFPGTMTAHW